MWLGTISMLRHLKSLRLQHRFKEKTAYITGVFIKLWAAFRRKTPLFHHLSVAFNFKEMNQIET